jgi:hypothetical protein
LQEAAFAVRGIVVPARARNNKNARDANDDSVSMAPAFHGDPWASEAGIFASTFIYDAFQLLFDHCTQEELMNA